MPRPTAAARAGTLYVVATPIGNLEDITLRALKVLKAAALVAAEDTRRTAILLRQYDIATPVLSVHEHNERRHADLIIERLARGESVALVTDAGTPTISDPGAYLVAEVRKAGYVVEPIPGPSAVVAALSASGLVGEGFSFVGFVPNRLNARKKWWAEVVEESSKRAVVFFETPHRLQSTLRELSSLVERPITVCRELTKVHEEIRQDTPSNLLKQFEDPRGEFTIVIPQAKRSEAERNRPSDAEIAQEFGHITLVDPSSSRRDAIRKLAAKLGLPTKVIYASLERAKLG
ncbi:MAG: 16S rRNA (cytidine(1402)-2'-O)-methyltransferase [Vicinamibacterales bacterium]